MTESNYEHPQPVEETVSQNERQERHTARNATVAVVGIGVLATGALLFPDTRERRFDVGYTCPDGKNIGTIQSEKVSDEEVVLHVPCDGQEDNGDVLRIRYANDGKLIANLIKNNRPTVDLDSSADPDRVTLHDVHSLISATVVSR